MVISLVANSLIVIFTVLSLYIFDKKGGDANMKTDNKYHFFTVDSNILCAVTSLIVVIAEIVAFCQGTDVLPDWVMQLKFVGTSAVALTFLTVVVFLGPTMGYGKMFEGTGFFLHGVNPVLAIFSLLFFEKGGVMTWWTVLYGMIPTFLYGTLYFVKVVVLPREKGGWGDFYSFNQGGKWPISMALMLIGDLIINVALKFAYLG